MLGESGHRLSEGASNDVKRGCFIGFCGVLTLVCLLLFVIGYYAGKTDLVLAASRTDTIAFVGERGAVQIRVDPNQPAVLDLLRTAAQKSFGYFGLLIDRTVPYEMGLSINADRGNAQADMVVALSMRRLAGFLESVSDTELWRWFPFQRVQSARLERDGLWVARSTLPIDAGALSLANAHWAKPAGTPLTLTRDHGLEVVLDNRNGEAYLVLNTFINPPLQAGDLPPDPAANKMTQDDFVKILERMETLRFTADLFGNDHAVCDLIVTCEDETMARGVNLLLLYARDQLYLNLLEKGVEMDGEITLEGATVTGRFNLRGFHKRIVTQISGMGV